MALLTPDFKNLVDYDALQTDEDRAIYIFASQFYDIIVSKIESLGIEYADKEIALMVQQGELTKEYYNAVKNGFDSGDLRTLDNFLSNTLSNIYNGLSVMKSLHDNLPTLIEAFKDYDTMSTKIKAEKAGKLLSDTFGIIDSVSGAFNEPLLSQYVSVVFGMGKMCLDTGLLMLEEHNKKLEEAIQACLNAMPKNGSDERSNFCGTLGSISNYLSSYESEFNDIGEYYNSIKDYIDVADVGQKIENKISNIKNNLSNFLNQLNSNLNNITLTDEEKEIIDSLYNMGSDLGCKPDSGSSGWGSGGSGGTGSSGSSGSAGGSGSSGGTGSSGSSGGAGGSGSSGGTGSSGSSGGAGGSGSSGGTGGSGSSGGADGSGAGNIKDSAEKADEKTNEAEKVKYDPLVIDMGKAGFELTNIDNGVYFDMDSNGLSEKTGWITGDDAFLALDLNGDGKINNSGELFGDRTMLSDGTYAKSGFEALAHYDTNLDGIINAHDEVYNQLLLWQDKNKDGISTADELMSLKDVGISAINLNYQEKNSVNDSNGSILANVSSVTFNDGTETAVGEFKFSSNRIDTTDIIDFQISDDILALPNVRAVGSVHSLHYAMAMDSTGKLAALVKKFVESEDLDEREALVNDILYELCGVTDIDPASRGQYVDARQLAVIEKMIDRNFSGQFGANPNVLAGPILQKTYKDLASSYYTELSYKNISKYLNFISVETSSDGKKHYDLDLFNSYVYFNLKSGSVSDLILADIGRFLLSKDKYMFIEFTDYFSALDVQYGQTIKKYCGGIIGTDSDDKISVFEESVIIGASGNDTLYGSDYNDIFWGGTGNDTVSGYNGDDIIHGEVGDDKLYGNNGDDTIYGEAGNDKLYGGNGNDIISGGMGNDYLDGGNGNDTYVFNLGDGNDTIYDYENSPTEGKEDKIVFGNGVTPDNVTLNRDGNDLVIRYSENDSITVKNAYSNTDGRYFIENIEFADGSKLDMDEIMARSIVKHGTDSDDVMNGYNDSAGYSQNETFYAGAGNDTVNGNNGDDTIYGEAGNDKLYGGNGNDIISGGTGDDYLDGSYGNDTYIFKLGDGNDTIYDYENSPTEGKEDKIVFGEGITPDNVTLIRDGNSLVIRYSENDSITVKNAYSNTDGMYFIENIEFADGSKWDIDEIMARSIVKHGTDSNDVMNGYNDSTGYSQNETFYAGAGNDTVNGNNGDDAIYGEAGNDKLYGGNGNDIISGGTENDYLDGGHGNDTYVFNLGDGNDTIYDYENSPIEGKEDKIVFGEGITPDNVTLIRDGNNLVIRYSENDSITVKNAYSNTDGMYFIENIEFADGSKWDIDEITARSIVKHGTDSDDSINGYNDSIGYSQNETFYAGDGNDNVRGNNGDDIIYGEAGNDKLYGGNGNDIIIGGAGDDYLDGSYGNDTYIFKLGDGNDTVYDFENSPTEGKEDKIVFGEGITPDNVTLIRNGNNLVIRYSENDSITVKNAYSNTDGMYFIENIEFADGTNAKINKDTLKFEFLEIDNHYEFSSGNGAVSISDYEGNDTLQINADILNLIFSRSGDNLDIKMNNTNDVFTVNDWFINENNQIETIIGNDGYALTNNQVQLLIENMSSYSNDNNISWSEAIEKDSAGTRNVLEQIWIKTN